MKEQYEYDPQEFLKGIDESMPLKEQLGDMLNAVEVPTSSLQIGDEVFIKDFYDVYDRFKVVGFGDDKYVNGRNVKDIPYVNKYDHNGENDYTWNINNYILTETVLVPGR